MSFDEFALMLTVSPRAKPKAEVSLEDRERILRSLMGRLPVMVYRCADDAQWTMEFVSAGAEEITGYKPEELVGNARLAYTDLVVPWHYEGVCRDIQSAIEKHNAWTTSYPIITASGDRKWVWERGVAVLDDAGRAIALEGIIIDMTLEREAEESLELALAEWRQVFDAMDDAVLVLGGDGEVLRANAAAAALSGLDQTEMAGLKCSNALRRLCGQAQGVCPRDRALLSGRTEMTYVGHEGRLLRLTFKPTPVMDGRVNGGLHMVSDVTDAVRARPQDFPGTPYV